MSKLSKAPQNALKDKELVQILDKSKAKSVEKQTMARVNSRVFLSGSQIKDGIKIESFDQLRGFNPSMS